MIYQTTTCSKPILPFQRQRYDNKSRGRTICKKIVESKKSGHFRQYAYREKSKCRDCPFTPNAMRRTNPTLLRNNTSTVHETVFSKRQSVTTRFSVNEPSSYTILSNKLFTFCSILSKKVSKNICGFYSSHTHYVLLSVRSALSLHDHQHFSDIPICKHPHYNL